MTPSMESNVPMDCDLQASMADINSLQWSAGNESCVVHPVSDDYICHSVGLDIKSEVNVDIADMNETSGASSSHVEYIDVVSDSTDQVDDLEMANDIKEEYLDLISKSLECSDFTGECSNVSDDFYQSKGTAEIAVSDINPVSYVKVEGIEEYGCEKDNENSQENTDIHLQVENTSDPVLRNMSDGRSKDTFVSEISPCSTYEMDNIIIPSDDCVGLSEPASSDHSDHMTKHHLNDNSGTHDNVSPTALVCHETGGSLNHLKQSNLSDSINELCVPAEINQRTLMKVKKSFPCLYCDKIFNEKGNLTKHLRIHTGEKPFACLHCDKKFADKWNLSIHVRIHTGDRPFPCPHCEKRFNEKGSLTLHIRTHTGDKPFSCCHCDKKFTGKWNLTMHMRAHTGDRPFPCTYCDKRFNNKTDRTKHVRTHTGEKPFTCCHCEKAFSDKWTLTVHIRSHTGEKPFHCPHCEKKFCDKPHLTRHIRTHTGQKPYHCPYCEKRFTDRSDLTKHIRIHTGEKPFPCPHCAKRFHDKWNLSIHVRTHTGEKPYPCPDCGKRFTAKPSLTLHQRTHK